jgi:hypothetical protein
VSDHEDRADLRLLAGTGEVLRVERGGETHVEMLHSVDVAPGAVARVEVGFAVATKTRSKCECGGQLPSARHRMCAECRRAKVLARQREVRREEKEVTAERARKDRAKRRARKPPRPAAVLCGRCTKLVACPRGAKAPTMCRDCSAAARKKKSAAYYAEFPERRHLWRQSNPEKALEASRRLYAKNEQSRLQRRVAEAVERAPCLGCGERFPPGTRRDARVCGARCYNLSRKNKVAK